MFTVYARKMFDGMTMISALLNGLAVAHVAVIVIIVRNQASGIKIIIGIGGLWKTFKELEA
ncbi:hypothetical protein ACOSQ3_020738 [Xanthoceras sorbifolium]